MRGHRLLLVTITPFSVEKASDGRPWMFQSLTDVGLARNVAKEKSGVQGTCNSRTCSHGNRVLSRVYILLVYRYRQKEMKCHVM